MINLLSIENIVGRKFPANRQKKTFLIRSKSRTPGGVTDREYRQERKLENIENRKKFNPNGFYEDRYVMRGFSYDSRGLEHYENLANSPGKAVKILGRGLVNTHPRYVDKLIICIRNPSDIARSQKILHGRSQNLSASALQQLRDYNKISKYLMAYPDIPYIVVHYNEHIKIAADVMKKLATFLDVPFAESPYNPNTSQNTNKEIFTGQEWDLALKIQDHIQRGEFKDFVGEIEEVYKE